MSDTSIEWTDKVWNPLRGCSKVSEGCKNCYAIKTAHRFSGEGQPFEGLTENNGAGVNWTGKVNLVFEKLDDPLHWKKPAKIFVNSMSDVFHPEVPFDYIRAIWARMASCPQHTFQVLTKRPARAVEFFDWMRDQEFKVEESLSNVWLGVSVENQKAANERIPLLLQTPAAVRFLSCEPLLGFVDLTGWLFIGGHGNSIESPIHWIIAGGESGYGARPMHPDWARSLRDQSHVAGVAFLFKQWGEWAPGLNFDEYIPSSISHDFGNGDDIRNVWKVGKKIAGRMLDGRTWDEFPVSVSD